MKTVRRYRCTRNGVTTDIPSTTDLMAFLGGISRTTAVRYSKEGRYLDCKIEVFIDKVKPTRNRHPLPVLITSPDKVTVQFTSSRDAALALGISPMTISHFASLDKSKLGYAFTRGKRKDTSPLTKEWHDAFRDTFRSYIPDSVPKAEEKDERIPIATGHYDYDFAPVVCPICGAVMAKTPDFNKDGRTTNLAQMHLEKCLEGHEYKIVHSIIKVYD